MASISLRRILLFKILILKFTFDVSNFHESGLFRNKGLPLYNLAYGSKNYCIG